MVSGSVVMKLTTLETNCWPAASACIAMLVAHAATLVMMVVSAVAMLAGSCWNHARADWKAAGMVTVKKLAICCPHPVMVVTTVCHALLMNWVKEAQSCRPVSVWVKKRASAATTAAMAVTMSPMGLAASTALKAPWTAVAAVVMAFHAAWAVLTMFMLDAICLMVATGPPRSIMSMMPLLSPLAPVVTAFMVPVRACSPALSA